MAITVSNVVDAAIEMAAPYGQGPMPIPQKALIRYLGVLDRRVVGQISREAPHLLSSAGTAIAVTTSGQTAGYTLTAGLRHFDFWYRNSNEQVTPIRIVPEAELRNPPVHPAGVLRGSGSAVKFYPADPQGTDWLVNSTYSSWWAADGDDILYRYITLPTAPTARTSTLSTPDDFEQYFVAVLYRLCLQLNRAPQDMIEAARIDEEVAKRDMGMSIMKARPVEGSFANYRVDAGHISAGVVY
jgi:hypothetical protein